MAFAGVLALSGALVGCAPRTVEHPDPPASAPLRGRCAPGALVGEGSSAQQNAIDAWRRLYQENCPGASIAYTPSGSGAGIAAFIDRRADFGGSDSTLSEDEQRSADARCRSGPAVHLPLVVGPIAVVYRVKGLRSLQLRPATVAKIFSGVITTWDDPAIRADNPDAILPNTAIRTVHRSDSSGTTDNFTAFLVGAAAADWTFGRARDWKAPGGSGVKGSVGVVDAVKKTNGAIGYVELSFANTARLTVAGIGDGSGQFARPTADSVERMLRGAKVAGRGQDLKVDIDYPNSRPAAYPIVLLTYEIVCAKGLAADKAALARSFLSFAASAEGQRELRGIGYAPLPESLQPRVEAAANAIS
jgi:phosphate transport system substrate-binding protein